MVGRNDGFLGPELGRRTLALVEQPGLGACLPRAQRAPAHPQVALDGPGDRRARHHLAREAGVLGVERDDGVHVGGGAADVDHRDRTPHLRGQHLDAGEHQVRGGALHHLEKGLSRACRGSARVLSALPPITCRQEHLPDRRRAGSGASTPILGTTLSVTTYGVPAPGEQRGDPRSGVGVARHHHRQRAGVAGRGRPRRPRAPRRCHRRCHRRAAPGRGPLPAGRRTSARRGRPPRPRRPCRRWRARPGGRPPR